MIFPLVVALVSKQATAPPFMRFPDIHGDKVVFTSESDLWLGNVKTGEAHRLTSDAGMERNASFSPDGTKIAFEAEYDGQRQVYVMPTTGGTPKRLTSLEGCRAVTGWSPDGSDIVFRAVGQPTSYSYQSVPATGGVPTKFPLEFASHVSYGPDKQRYVFTRFAHTYTAWFRYIGGMQNQVWLREPGTVGKEFRQITDIEGTNEFPVWCGDRVYFSNENKAHFTLMSVPWSGGKPRKEYDSEFEIRELSSDGKKIIFEDGRDIAVFDPATSKTTKVAVDLNSDFIHARPNLVLAESLIQDSSISPTGKRLLVEARGQILSVALGEGEARVLKATPGIRYRHPMMSPDAKKYAYVDDSSGEAQIYLTAFDGSSSKQLTKRTEGQIWGVRFSPDGKWVSYTDSEMRVQIVSVETGEEKTAATIPFTWFEAAYEFSPDSQWITYAKNAPITALNVIYLYHIPTGKTHQVSDGRANDSAPAFSTDGKYLVFASGRSLVVKDDPILNQLNLDPINMLCVAPLKSDGEDPLAPKDSEEGDKKDEKKEEFRIDLDGLFTRRVEIPAAPAKIVKVAMSGPRIIYATDAGVKFYDISKKAGGDLVASPSFTLSADGQTLLLTTTPPSSIGINGDNRKAPAFGGLRLRVDPVAEWKQMFWDAWRHLRDYFYVPNMHGLDWKAIGDKYAAYLPSVRSRYELDELIRWMQSEIGSSHQYLRSGDAQDLKPRVGGAYLGAELAADPSGYYRIEKIYKGDGFQNSERSPLLGAGKNIKEGMFLLAIGGQPVSTDSDPYEKLTGRAGRPVSILVNDKPTTEGAKSYIVVPVGSEMRMRYLSWVEANRTYVAQKSGGKLGYLHLAAMSNGDMQDFVRQYFYQRDKEGFLIDGRFNNGGSVQDLINRILNESLTGFFNMRNSPLSWTRQQDYFVGPMAMLINEFDISCGEEFPHRFRDLKRGPLFGRRTMGGEVGSDPGWPLVDGGGVSVPNYGMYTPDGKWAIEGLGVSPDYDVPSDPNAYVQNRDPQMDRAIEWLLAEIKKRPPVNRQPPPARDRVKNGSG